MKILKHIYYPVLWIFTLYASSFVVNVATSGGLTWYYNASPGYGNYTASIEYYVSFPDITEKMFFLIWFIGFSLTCFIIILIADGISRKLNRGEHLFPQAEFAIAQSVVAVLYLIIGVATGYNGRLYFFTVFLRFVLNEIAPQMITPENEFAFATGINCVLTLIFVIFTVIFYQKERKHQQYRLERERLHKEEMRNEAT